MRDTNCLPFASIWVFAGVRVAHHFSFLCCGFCWGRVAHLFSFLCCCFVFVCLSPVFCVPNVATVSELSIRDCPILFFNVY